MISIGTNEHATLTLFRMFELLSINNNEKIHSLNEKLFWSYPFSEYQATLASLSTGLQKDNKLVRFHIYCFFEVNLYFLKEKILLNSKLEKGFLDSCDWHGFELGYNC